MDIIIFAIATIVAIGASLYLYAGSQVASLKKNWAQYRCNPIYMPFAGMVGDDVMSNFTKCTMTGFQTYTGFVMDPILAEFGVVNSTLEEVSATMGSMRSMMSSVRGGFLGIIGSVFGKIQNVMGQTQYTIIRMRTLMSRVVGIMYSFVYIFYGGMQSGESLANGPVGRTMSVLCFDENTKIQTFEGMKAMKDVKIGDRLQANLAIVTSLYKIDGEGVQMYSLSDILVSGSHKVRYKGKFIRVDKHPSAKKVRTPSERLVCLNTSSHRISIKNYEFLDFVESEDTEFMKFKNTYIQLLYNGTVREMPSEYTTGILYGTYISTMEGPKMVQDLELDDVLENGDIIKGICSHILKGSTYVEIGSGILAAPGTWVYKDNKIVRADTFGNEYNNDIENCVVYQLITDSSMYTVLGKDTRLKILDELQTTEPFYHSMKDTIITSGRFRNKLVVV
jgi:hypothetical protein